MGETKFIMIFSSDKIKIDYNTVIIKKFNGKLDKERKHIIETILKEINCEDNNKFITLNELFAYLEHHNKMINKTNYTNDYTTNNTNFNTNKSIEDLACLEIFNELMNISLGRFKLMDKSEEGLGDIREVAFKSIEIKQNVIEYAFEIVKFFTNS